MSAKTYEGQLIAPAEARFAVVVGRFNEFVTSKLLDGAMDAFVRHAVPAENVDVAWSPGSFEIYNDVGSPGQVDYGSALDSASFSVGRGLFEWTSEAFSDGTGVWWAVRSKSPDGVLEDNTVTVAAEADATGPAVHSSVVGTRTDDTP